METEPAPLPNMVGGKSGTSVGNSNGRKAASGGRGKAGNTRAKNGQGIEDGTGEGVGGGGEAGQQLAPRPRRHAGRPGRYKDAGIVPTADQNDDDLPDVEVLNDN